MEEDLSSIPNAKFEQLGENIIEVDSYIICLDEKETSYLGKGSFGKVYKAKSNLDKENILAVKIIERKNRNFSPVAINREKEILYKLSHKNIVKLYRICKTISAIYLFFEYCKGGNLRNYLKKFPLSENEAFIVIRQITEAMNYCQKDFQVIHRDLNPNNILLQEEKEERSLCVKVADFGLARVFEGNISSSKSLTNEIGTLPYRAIEVNEGNYSSKCDIWSIGIIFYELLFRRLPWSFKNVKELNEKKKRWDIEKDEKLLKSEFKEETKILLKKLLQKDQDKRIDCPTLKTELDCPSPTLKTELNINRISKKIKQTFDGNLININDFNRTDNYLFDRNKPFCNELEQYINESQSITTTNLILMMQMNKNENNDEMVKKNEEFLSFRLNIVFFLRRLFRDFYLFWDSDKKLEIPFKQLLEIFGVLKLFEVLIMLELKNKIENKKNIENSIFQCNNNSKLFVIENYKRSYTNYMKFVEETNHFMLNENFSRNIEENPENFKFCERIHKEFLQSNWKSFDIFFENTKNEKYLMVLKEFLLAANYDKMKDYFKCEYGRLYYIEFCSIYSEIKQPNLEKLKAFCLNSLKEYRD